MKPTFIGIIVVAAAVAIVGGVVGGNSRDSTTSTADTSASTNEAKFRVQVDSAIEGAMPGFCEEMARLTPAQAYTWMGDKIDNLGNPSPDAKIGLGSIYKQECARILAGQ